MLANFVLTVLLLQVEARPTSAPRTMPLQPGDRVQVFAPTLTTDWYKALTGSVKRIGPTDLVVTTSAGAERQIPLAAIVDLRRDSTASRKRPHWEVLSLRMVRPQPLPGTFVRIVSPRLATNKPVRGTIRSWGADSIVFESERDAAVVELPANEVSSVEWPVHVRRATRTGSSIGWAIGLVAGVIMSASIGKPCTHSSGPDPLGLNGLDDLCSAGKVLQVTFGAGGGALVGAGLGAAIGHSIRWTEWERGEPGGRRISFAPLISLRGAGVMLSVGFSEWR